MNPEDYPLEIARLEMAKNNEPMPEFENGDDAFEWMERRLNKSWVDDAASILGVGEPVADPKAADSSSTTTSAFASPVKPSAGTHASGPAVDISLEDFEAMWNNESS